jgi:two-component system, NtrC family, sensor histidine kinase HydH
MASTMGLELQPIPTPASAVVQQAQLSPRPFNLFRWFLVVGLVAITIVCGAGSWLLTHTLTARMLKRDAEVSRDFLESILWAENISKLAFEQPTDQSLAQLAPFVEHLPTLPGLHRANLYSLDRVVVWSTDAAIIGQRFEGNDELDRALKGEIVVETGPIASSEQKPEHVGLGRGASQSQREKFVEAYLPIRGDKAGKILAVVEIYKVPHDLFEAIDRDVLSVWIGGAVGGLLLYFAFIGIVRRGDALMQAQRERLVEAETFAAVGEMAAAVAHSIRNPLASIRSAAELASGEEQQGIAECLDDIVRETDRLDSWVRQLLLAASNTGVETELIEINSLIREVLVGYTAELKRRQIQWSFREGLSSSVSACRATLAHAIGAVVANAIQSMPTGGKLTIDTEVGQQGLRIIVADTGRGMAKPELARAFKPFFTTKPNGVGLGLALTRRILERHGGNIQLESSEGQGTRAVLMLPL